MALVFIFVFLRACVPLDWKMAGMISGASSASS